MLRSMTLGGVDEELANQVGLYSALNMPFSWQQHSEAQDVDGVMAEAEAKAIEIEAAPSPAPATPPIASFTSSLQAPRPGSAADGLGKYLEPPLPVVDCAVQELLHDHAVPSSSGQVTHKKEGHWSVLKVTGLGQLARLIELGCNVGSVHPSADSVYCSRASDGQTPAVEGSCDVLAVIEGHGLGAAGTSDRAWVQRGVSAPER